MSEEYGLERELNELRRYRRQLEQLDTFYKESEMSYQMISLYMELDKLLTGKYYSKDYIQEKATTLVHCFRNILEGKVSR